jgi:hypothetical protein
VAGTGETHAAHASGMRYARVHSRVGADVCVDYVEAAPDGTVRRLISHVGGRWWRSAAAPGDKVAVDALDPASYIAAEEFEHAWRLAGGRRRARA